MCHPNNALIPNNNGLKVYNKANDSGNVPVKPYKVYLDPTGDYLASLRAGLKWLGAEAALSQSAGIFIKPNLTYPEFRPGVTTTREMLEAAMQVFTELHPRVMVGESDGGYGSFDIEEAFASFDLHNLGRQYGARIVNLSQEPTVRCTLPTRRGPLHLDLPRFLIEEDFVTVTLPVPKVHCMTGVSLSYKNQWGCIPDTMRLRLHPCFNEIIGPLNRLLKVGLSIIDGTHGLTKNGPIMEGEVVHPGWLVMSPHPGAADRVASHLMGLKLEDYAHYRRIREETGLPELTEIDTNRSLAPFAARTPKFYLKRNFWNYVAKTTWYSRHWGYCVYESPVADLLHRVMYTFRPRPEGFRPKSS
jgi:uncharacterized protein (DUF362 family)